MEVKSGYKQSEIGPIPRDWNVKNMDSVASITRLAGAEYSSVWKETPNGEIVALRGFNIGENKIIERDITRISNKLSLSLSRSRLRKGDVVYPCVGTIGNAVVIEEDNKFHIQQNIARLIPRNELFPHYLAYYLMSRLGASEVQRFNATSSQPNVLVGSLRQYRIPLPSTINEQRSIAAVLIDMDALISALDQLITNNRYIKQAAMQQLLTGKQRLPGFNGESGYKETEAGVIPDDWIVLPFIRAVDAYIDYRGRTPRKLGLSWGDGDILALSANNVQMGKINSDKEAYFASEELYRKWMVQGECEKGDVLLTMEAPLGNVAQIPNSERYILSQRVLLIKPKDWLLRDFLAHYMRAAYFQRQLFLNSTGSTAKGIQRKRLDYLPVYFPPTRAEQEAIVDALGDMDAEIAALEKRRDKTRALKQAMMQELLTGKTRLV